MDYDADGSIEPDRKRSFRAPRQKSTDDGVRVNAVARERADQRGEWLRVLLGVESGVAYERDLIPDHPDGIDDGPRDRDDPWIPLPV